MRTKLGINSLNVFSLYFYLISAGSRIVKLSWHFMILFDIGLDNNFSIVKIFSL